MSHVIDLENLGMPCDDAGAANAGARDCSPLWNSTIPGVKEGDTMLAPPHYCAFKSPLLPLPSGVKLMGQGGQSNLVRCFSQGPSDTFLTTGITNSSVEDIALWAGDGTSGGRAIGRHATSPADAPYKTSLKNVVITRNDSGRFFAGVWIDGCLGKEMYGARRLQVNDLIVSGCTGIGMWLGGLNSSTFNGVTLGAGSPTWALWIFGAANNPSAQLKFDGTDFGNLLMYRTLSTKIEVSAVQSIILDADCASVEIEAGFLSQEPPTLLGKNLTVMANGKQWRSAA